VNRLIGAGLAFGHEPNKFPVQLNHSSAKDFRRPPFGGSILSGMSNILVVCISDAMARFCAIQA
jgi:hypothetical protein